MKKIIVAFLMLIQFGINSQAQPKWQKVQQTDFIRCNYPSIFNEGLLISDMNYSTNNGDSWSQLNIPTDDSTYIDARRLVSIGDTMFAVSNYGAGYVMKSHIQQINWQKITSMPVPLIEFTAGSGIFSPGKTISRLQAIDGVLYCIREGEYSFGYKNDVLCSTNLGRTWINFDSILNPQFGMGFYEAKGNRIMLGVDSDMKITYDFGQSFTSFPNVINNYSTTMKDSTLFAVSGTHVFKYQNNMWQYSGQGIDTSLGIESYLLKTIGNFVYALTNNGVYISIDGSSWGSFGNNLSNIRVNNIIQKGDTLFITTNAGFYRKTFLDASWTLCSNGIKSSEGPGLLQKFNAFKNSMSYDIRSVGYYSPSMDTAWDWHIKDKINIGNFFYGDSRVLIARKNDATLNYLRSTNGGSSWHPILQNNLTFHQIIAGGGDTLFALRTEAPYMMYSANLGQNWIPALQSLPYNLSFSDYGRLFRHRHSLYVSTPLGLCRTTNGGNNWQTFPDLKNVSAVSGRGDTVFALTRNSTTNRASGLWRSTNNGINWTNISANGVHFPQHSLNSAWSNYRPAMVVYKDTVWLSNVFGGVFSTNWGTSWEFFYLRTLGGNTIGYPGDTLYGALSNVEQFIVTDTLLYAVKWNEVSYRTYSGKAPIATSLPAFSNRQRVQNAVHLAVYPNPAQDYVNIERSGSGILLVSDVTGKLVHQARLSGDATYTLPTTHWQRGIYIITWQNEEGVVMKKLVKE